MKIETNPTKLRRFGVLAVLALAFMACGCLELETRIKLHEDGSAVVTERLKISRKLREIESGVKEQLGTNFEDLLSKERAQQRAAEMGSGVVLVSHKVEDGPAASRQAVTIYRVADLRKLTYVSPFFMRGEHMGRMKISITPQLEDKWGQRAGILWLQVKHQEVSSKPSQRLKELTTMEESPQVRQGYRDIVPIFRNLLKGFKVRMIFENYGEILGTGWRASQLFPFQRPREVNIINYSYGGETGGKTGTHPLDDEEVVVDLMKLLLARPKDPWCRRKGPFLGKHMGQPWFNAVIRPSRPLFDRYFKGKELTFGQGHGRPGLKKMADFARIGETPENQRQSIQKDK